MSYAAPEVGVVGKPNAGKSTFFAAATLVDVKRAPYPFTTIEANVGVAYVRFPCVCKKLGVKDNPRNSLCVEGWRYAPIKLIDVAGLVPDAWQGRGLGNRFLDELRRASVLIHVVDASGGTDEEGRPIRPGTHDPLLDVKFLEREITMWMYQIIKKEWDKLSKITSFKGLNPIVEIQKRLSGIGVLEHHVERAIETSGLSGKPLAKWTDENLLEFIDALRRESKPMLIAANKADIPEAVDNIKRMQRELKGKYIVIPTCAEAELALRKAAQKGLVKYIPGDNKFEILGSLDERQKRALKYIQERVFDVWGGTGVQDALNAAIFDQLGYIAVYPVENETKFTDHEGRVLPDVFLVPPSTTARDLAYLIHSEIGDKFAFAIDAITGKRLSASAVLHHRSVIKIVTSR